MRTLREFPVYLWLVLGGLVLAGAWAAGQGLPFLLWITVAAKAVLISEHFMELGRAPLAWRLAVPGWILLVSGCLAWLLP